MESHNIEHHKSTFWQKNIKPMPGRPCLRRELPVITKLQHSLCSTTSQDLELSKIGVWEILNGEFYNALNVDRAKKVVSSVELRRMNRTLPSQVSSESKFNIQLPNVHTYLASLDEPSDSVIVNNSRSHKSNETPQSLNLQQLALKEDHDTMLIKVNKFKLLLETAILDLDDLRHVSWSGIPSEERPIVWRLLAGYLPASLERRIAVLEQKRSDYWNLVNLYFDPDRSESQDTYRQIHIDIPRMSPLLSLIQQKSVQEIFERILFIWAIRHPASGYVQGMNDLVTPFYIVFMQEFLAPGDDLYSFEINSLPRKCWEIIEADSFWCLSKLLNGIQDNYIFAQLGIQHKVKQLEKLIKRVDSTLHNHLERHGIDYLQFSFRWMNNLLMREMPLKCSVRLWDTYLAENDNFASFHLYVCAAFLLRWRHHLLLQQDFQGLMLTLQNLPTHNWTETDIGVLVAEAYKLKFLFADAPHHLKSRENISSRKF